jgi:hypothetical protein
LSSANLKIPSPPPLAPFARGGNPGQAAFLNQQAAINEQVELNKKFAGGKKYKGGSTTIKVETVPSPYKSSYGPDFNEKMQLQNAGTAGQSELYAKYDKFATVKGGKRMTKKRKRSYKRMTGKRRRSYKRMTGKKRRTYKK